MLAPRFKEGRELAHSSTVEIPLPDDEPVPMVILCNIMHMRHDAVPRKLAADQIIRLAETCDKYACANAVKPSVEGWVSAVLQSAGEPVASHSTRGDGAHGQLLTAVCLLRSEELVQCLATELVIKSKIPVTQISKASSIIQENFLGTPATLLPTSL